MLIKTGGNALLDVNYILKKIDISQNMVVADLGCGSSGHFIFPISQLIGKRGKVYAVDILKTVLETVSRRVKQENIENIETVWTDLEVYKATKIENGSLDIALLANTLYQSQKRPEILRESARLLKKNGKMVVVEWKNIASHFGPPPEMQVNKEQIKLTAGKLGLVLEEEFDAGIYHYGLIFIKA
jgi:ubiquinone/menaquinone biosynthesis C-methylase UbiE